MPRRRTSLKIPDDPADDNTEESRLTRRTHSSGHHAMDHHSNRDHEQRKRHEHSRRKKEPEQTSKSAKKRSSKHRHKDHRHHSHSRGNDRYHDDDDDYDDEDPNDEDMSRGLKEHHNRHHHSRKKESHKHHSRKHKHRSKHHHSSSARRPHYDDHEEEYYHDLEDMDRDTTRRDRIRREGRGEGLALRSRARYHDDHDEQDIDHHPMFRGTREGFANTAAHRTHTADPIYDRHAQSSGSLHRGERLDDADFAIEQDVPHHSSRRTSRSGGTQYPYQRTDYRRDADLEEAEQERASERSRRRSYLSRHAADERPSHRDRRHARYEDVEATRRNGHDGDIGAGFAARDVAGNRPGTRDRSRSRSQGRYGEPDDMFEDQTRAHPRHNHGRGYGGAGVYAQGDYPEGTDLSDESRHRGPPPDGSHPTPSGYPTENREYDLSFNSQAAGPRLPPNAPGRQPGPVGGIGQRVYGAHAPPPGYRMGPSPVRPGGGSFGMIGGRGYRSGSHRFYRQDFDLDDFDDRSSLSDDLDAAERHAAMVRYLRREKERSRRYRHGRRSRHHRHSHHGHHRRHKHRSHRRHRGDQSYSRKHRDLTRALSENSHQTEDLNTAEGYDDSRNAEVGDRAYPVEEGAQAERYDQERYDYAGDPEEEEDPRKKIFTKRNAAKAGLFALAAIAAGLIVRKMVKKRRAKKQAEEEEWSDNEEATVDENGIPMMPSFRPPPLPIPGMFSVKVPQNQAVIIERGGKYHRKLDAGNNPFTPCVDKVAYCLSLKELRVPIPYQQFYAKDNIPLRANGFLFMKIEDPVAATYDVDNPYHTAVHLTQTCMRNEIAKLTVHEAMEERTAISDRVLDQVNDACRPWGVRCMRFELQDLEVPDDMKETMEKEAEAERNRRLKILESEAEREEAINRAEGQLQAQMRMSQARQLEIVNQAIGEAHAIEERGQAVAHAMRDVLEVIREPGGEQAMQMRIAEQFINAYSNATREPSIRPPEPNNMAATMNNAIDLLNTLGENENVAQIPLAQLPAENPFDVISGEQTPPNGASSNGGRRTNGAARSNGHGGGRPGHSEPSTPPRPRSNRSNGISRPPGGTPIRNQQAVDARK